MGCDIHAHIEIKLHGKWEHYSAPHIDRNYSLFAKMAGVRAYGDEVDPISLPRGLPTDLSAMTAYAYEIQQYDAHSMSWLSWQEMHEVEEWYRKTFPEKPIHPSRPFGYLFGHGWNIFAYLSDMKSVPGVTDARVVFWFDN